MEYPSRRSGANLIQASPKCSPFLILRMPKTIFGSTKYIFERSLAKSCGSSCLANKFCTKLKWFPLTEDLLPNNSHTQPFLFRLAFFFRKRYAFISACTVRYYYSDVNCSQILHRCTGVLHPQSDATPACFFRRITASESVPAVNFSPIRGRHNRR